MINPRVDKAIASGCFLGFLPVAPATFGSLWALPIWLLIHARWYLYGLGTLAIVILGTCLARDLIRTEGADADPRFFVIDEVAGLLIALLAVTRFDWRLLVTAFILFRIFDVAKPFPIKRLESIGQGVGVMADDLLAGVYAAVITALAGRYIF